MTPRERLLAIVMLGLGLGAAAFSAYDWSRSERDALMADRAELQDLQSGDNARDIRRLAAQVAGARASVKAKAWPVPSFQVARVLLEQQLAAAAARAGLADAEVRSDETPQVIGGQTFVRLDLGGAFSWASFAALDQALATAPHAYVLETAALHTDSDPPRLRLVALAPITIVKARR